MNNRLLFGLFVALLIGLVGLLMKTFPGVINNTSGYANLAYSLVVILLVTLSLFRNNQNWRQILSGSVSWLAIALILVGGYSYQYELKNVWYRIVGNIAPSLAQENPDGSVTIYGGQNGHFLANAEVNGAVIHFLIDTGASDVVLTPDDAKRAGIDVDALDYTAMVQTANGNTSTAPVRLEQIQIGTIIVHNVRANVSHSNLDTSLLGMSFLTRLKGYVVKHGALTLYQ